MLRRNKEIIQWLNFIYTLASLTYILYVQNSVLVIIPLLTLAIFSLIKELRSKIPLIVYASMFFISIAINEGIYISIPLSISMPFIIGKDSFVDDVRKQFIFGPSALQIFRYFIISSLLALVNPRILIPIAFSSNTIIVYAIYSYIKLSKVRIEISLVSDTVTWGEKAFALLSVETPFEANIVLYYGVNKNSYTVKDKAKINVELPANHVGRHYIEIYVYAFDDFFFSSRFVGRYLVEYNVVPLKRRILEVVGGYLTEISDILSLPPTIEFSIAQLSEEFPAATKARGKEAIKNIMEYIRRFRQRAYLGVILEELMKALEEITEKMGREGYGYRKSRYGEYTGSRPYTPGDSLRFIHWKKSASKGTLVVKEFSSSAIDESLLGSGGSEGIEPLILVDLYAPNIQELDKLIYSFLQLYLKIFKRSPTSKVLLVLVVGDIVISLRGRSAEILYQLYRVFVKTPIQTLFNYTSLHVLGENKVVELLKNVKKPKPLAILLLNNEKFANNLTKIIIGNEFIPPKPFTLIYSSSLNLRYTIVKHILSRYGFIYMDNIEFMNVRK
ncbi:MAG: DUF58 domain-containing protein [Ignisphaera sp.]